MKFIRQLFVFFLYTSLLSHCFEPDERLPKLKPQFVVLSNPDVYHTNSYFSLQTNTSTQKIETENWHLQFSSDDHNWAIFLNPKAKLKLHNTLLTNYNQVINSHDLSDVWWQNDVPGDRHFPVSAIGKWGDFNYQIPKSYKYVYVLRIQTDSNENYIFFQLLDAQEDKYILLCGTKGQIPDTMKINRDKNFRNVYANLVSRKQVKDLEPPRNEWDIKISLIPDSLKTWNILPISPYTRDLGLYPAIQLNDESNLLYMDTTMSFEDVRFFNSYDKAFLHTYQLPNSWIKIDFVNKIIVSPEKFSFVIKRKKDYYKLRIGELTIEENRKVKYSIWVQKL